MIKPMATKTAGKIVTHFQDHGLRVSKMKKARLSIEDINFIYRAQVTDPTFP